MQELERKLQEALLRNRELELKNTFLRSDNSQLQSNVDKLQSDITSLESDKGKLESNIGILQTKLTKLGDELLYLRRSISIRGKTRTCSLANKQVKVYLTRAAITAMCHDPQMKAYYKRKVEQGKHKASVVNAIRAKIIARCFAVIRRQTPYVSLVA
ncbi:hypothetical protein D0T57_01835 [Dysgonomonas sp. 511]|nr:hypothetical protein [Dysgonomonas sp. 511]